MGMQGLIRAQDSSHAVSIELALHAAGIETEVMPARLAAASALRAGTLFLVPERDHARALELVSQLQRTLPYSEPSSPTQRTRRIVAAVVVMMITLYAAWNLFGGR